MSADSRWRPGRTVLGVLTLVVLAGFLYYGVGVESVVDALTGVSRQRAASILLVAMATVVIWGVAFRLVLAGVGRRVTATRAVFVFNATLFLNSVTPFGQVGGDPLGGAVAADAGHLEYERGLAAVVGINALNRLAAVVLGFIGIGYLGMGVADVSPLRTVALTVIGLLAALVVVGFIIWRFHAVVEVGLTQGGAVVLALVFRAVPGREPPGSTDLRRRLRGFVEAVIGIASSPRRLGAVFGLCLFGQLFVSSTLWLALNALGAPTDLAIVLFVIPIAKLAGVAPTPGGFGSAEALITGLLVWVTSVPAAAAGAAAILYRAAAFWLPTVTGGLAMVWILTAKRTAVSGGPSELREDSHHRLRGPSAIAVILGGTFLVAVWGLWVVHTQQLLLEPTHPVVHLARDVSVGVLLFGLAWLVVGRFRRNE